MGGEASVPVAPVGGGSTTAAGANSTDSTDMVTPHTVPNTGNCSIMDDPRSKLIGFRSEALQRIQDIDIELAKGRGFSLRMGTSRLMAERENLVAKLQSEVKFLMARIAELDQQIAADTSGLLQWITGDQNTLLSAERQDKQEQLEGLLSALMDVGGAEDEIDVGDKGIRDLTALEVVPRGSAVWDTVIGLVNERSSKHTCHYGYRMVVKNIWRVPASPLMKSMEEKAARLGRPTQLFHGTSVENAAKIAENGFQLPRRHSNGGMFGKGIYFASTPLKSVNYTRREHWSSRFKGWLFSDEKSKGGLQMLICDVYLGRSRTLRMGARPRFDPDVDLKAGTFSGALGLGDYNSVYVPGGFLGAVRTTEYVVYDPSQAVPKYLIEFERGGLTPTKAK